MYPFGDVLPRSGVLGRAHLGDFPHPITMIRDGNSTGGDESASAQSSLIEVFPVQRGRRVVDRPGYQTEDLEKWREIRGSKYFLNLPVSRHGRHSEPVFEGQRADLQGFLQLSDGINESLHLQFRLMV